MIEKKEEENDNSEVIIIENPEIVGDDYTGEIISVHTGYVFIGNIRSAYAATETNGHVFCPVNPQSSFQPGELVKFSKLNPDKERAGKFRTEKIRKIQTGLAIDTPEGRMTAIANLSKTTSPYHQLKKLINDNDLSKAGENKPFIEFIQQIGWLLNQNGGYNPEDINKLAESFVEKTFAMLKPLGVKCSIMGDVDKAGEEQMINETISLYQENALQGQAESLQKEYAQFLKVREAFTLMHQNGLLDYSSVIDIKHLAELTFAFPVWFVSAKEGLPDLARVEDPSPDHAISFFSDCIGSREYAWFYQLYNRRTRPLSQFKGKDIMPPSIVRVMKQAKEIFDYVAIMTPYHDVASKEWSDPNWLRNIDPIMVGFLRGLPHMFVLGRWSGTGIFPMLLDCIADTANHITINKHLLKNFMYNSYWYKGLTNGMLSTDNDGESVLNKYAGKLLLAYERGILFSFLRGELKDNPGYNYWE